VTLEACPLPNLIRLLEKLATVGLDWATSFASSSIMIALIKLLLSLRRQARIGV